jgi:RHS repeat-associated protein
VPASALAQTATQMVEYYHTDALGSVRAVTKQVNGEWQVVARHDFMPFGEEVAPPIPPQDKRLFTGKERDNETGLDYFEARYYPTGVGRFTTIDPAMTIDENRVDPQRWNRYSYVRNNPLRYVDPDGREIVIENGNEEMLQCLASLVPEALRKFIRMTDSGLLDIKALNSVTTKNGSFLAIRTLANDTRTFTIAESGYATYREQGQLKVLDMMQNGISGLFLPADPSQNPYSTSSISSGAASNMVFIQRDLPQATLRETMVEELLAHAYLFALGAPYEHSRDALKGDDPVRAFVLFMLAHSIPKR